MTLFIFFLFIASAHSSEDRLSHREPFDQQMASELPGLNRTCRTNTEEEKIRRIKEFLKKKSLKYKKLEGYLERDDYIPKACTAQRVIPFICGLNVQADLVIRGLELYVSQTIMFLGCVGLLQDNKKTLEIRKDNPILKIVFGSNTDDGYISGFGFLFKDDSFVSFGSFLDPKQEVVLEEGENIFAIFGHSSGDIIEALGFVTTRNEYGPFGNPREDAESFSIKILSEKY
jgi:hypothetical protein